MRGCEAKRASVIQYYTAGRRPAFEWAKIGAPNGNVRLNVRALQ